MRAYLVVPEKRLTPSSRLTQRLRPKNRGTQAHRLNRPVLPIATTSRTREDALSLCLSEQELNTCR